MQPVGPATTVSWPAALSTHRYSIAGPAARAGAVPGLVGVLVGEVGQVVAVAARVVVGRGAAALLLQQREVLADHFLGHQRAPGFW